MTHLPPRAELQHLREYNFEVLKEGVQGPALADRLEVPEIHPQAGMGRREKKQKESQSVNSHPSIHK